MAKTAPTNVNATMAPNVLQNQVNVYARRVGEDNNAIFPVKNHTTVKTAKTNANAKTRLHAIHLMVRTIKRQFNEIIFNFV